MHKKILSWVLTAAMVFSLFTVMPLTAGATTAVCQVGTTEYDTLGAALAAVPNSGTIILLTDISYYTAISADGKSYTLDLAGHNLSVNAMNIYCLFATGGKSLSIVNSSPTPSNLNIQMTSATYYGAIFATLAGIITIAPNINTTIISNRVGVYAGDGGSVLIGNGSISADYTGIAVTYSGSVIINGNVTATGSGSTGLSTSGYSGGPDCSIHVTGNISSRYVGVDAGEHSSITVVGNIVDTGAFGACARYASTVDVTGSVTGVAFGVDARGGTITVDGDVAVTGTDSDCLGARAADMVSSYVPKREGIVEIGGSVTGYQYGAKAENGGSITVGGDAVSAGNSPVFTSSAVNAGGSGSTVTVRGNVIAAGQNSNAVEVYNGGAATVNGNVSATGVNCYGVSAASAASGSAATIDGTITATNYILIGAAAKTISDTTEPSTLSGYRMYTGATPASTVFVKAQAATPTANPAGGTVSSGTTVSLSAATVGASIFYTTDGSAPSASSTPYTGPISITGNTMIKAIAVKAGMNNSEVMSETYTITGQAAAPTANPAGGTVSSGTTVSLSTATAGASIYYTTDGSAPSALSTPYTGPISITSNTTIKAIAVKAGMADSEILVATYTEPAATPTANPAGGVVPPGTTVSLSTATAGASIYYTTDSTAPSVLNGILYSGPIIIMGTTTIKAIAVKPGMTDSETMSETYFFTGQAAAPTANPSGGTVSSGTAVSLSTATPGASIYYTTDGSAPSASSTFYAGPISITSNTTIKAIAVMAGIGDSEVMSETYTIAQNIDTGSVYYVITASAGTGGSISPSGKVSVGEYSDKTFTIKQDYGYRIDDVLVDGVSVGKDSEYKFSSVRRSHTIEAKFVYDCPSEMYADIDTSLWYHEGIDFVLSAGLFKGTSATTFEPDAAMTRAMTATMLFRFDGEPTISTENVFADVAAGTWYTDAVIWGANTGVILGYDSSIFGTNDVITREQLAAMLYRYAIYKGYDVSIGEDTNILSYNDAFDISEYAIPALQWACGSGIVQGNTSGYLTPQTPATRAEAALMLLRFYDLYVRA